MDAVHTNGPRDIFHALLAERLALKGELLLDFIVGATRQAESTGLGQGFQPGGNIHPIPVESFALHDYLADIDPHPELHPTLPRQFGVSPPEIPLDFDRTLSSVDDASELGEEIVPGRVDDTTVVLLDEISNDSPIESQRSDSGEVILTH
jgi:hypothetical protein